MYSVAQKLVGPAFILKISFFLAMIVVTTVLPIVTPNPIRAATDCSPDSIRYGGASWLGGSGVNVCNPGGGGSNYISNASGVSTLTGYKWQCVEMVNRLYLTRGWTSAFWQGDGNTLVNHIPSGLSKQNNGFISYINPGDLITLDDNFNGSGHAAVVNSVAVSGGATTINMINQNAEQVGSSAVIGSGSFAGNNAKLKMDGWGGYFIQAIIHRPGNSGSGGSNAFTPGVAREAGEGLHWYLRNTNTGGSADTDFNYGLSSDKPVTGDWDGNGSSTIGVVRKDGAGWHWYLRNSNSGGSSNYDFIFGLSSDIPVVGDWDDNGTVTAGVVRRDGAGWRWYLRNSNNGGAANVEFTFGVYATDRPITGDWDGNGSTTIGIYRQDGNNWHWYERNTNSSGSATIDFLYGLAATDIPIVGDWNGNVSEGPGVIRPDGNQLHWYERNYNSGGSADIDFDYGVSGDEGVAGNWN